MSNRFNRYAVILINFGIVPIVSAASNIVYDGSTGSGNQNVAVTDNANDGVYVIDSTDGSAKGDNLFHSFSEFNVSSGDTAQFTDSTSSNYNNVIVRVTGGNESTIRGEISTGANLGDANLYLLNPNGILFGEGASLNIGGSFHASTADQLIFGSAQDQIMPTGSTESNFYSAPVESFGFINPNPAAITVNNTVLEVNTGQQLSLIAGDITLTVSDPSQFSSGLKASDGSINITSVTGNTNVPLDNTNYSPTSELGAISISNEAFIDTSGDNGGHIVIRGGSLTMNQKGAIKNNINVASINTAGENDAGIDINVAGSISLDKLSSIEANSGFGASSRSDGIRIAASELDLNNGSKISSMMGINSNASNQDIHSEGLISINIDNDLNLDNGSSISTINDGVGKAAAIDIQTGTLNISNLSTVDASGGFYSTAGNGGDIYINANQVNIIGDATSDSRQTDTTGIQSNGLTFFDPSTFTIVGTASGSISVNADSILVTDNGAIKANNYSIENNGGNITLDASDGKIEILNGGKIELANLNIDAGGGGNISIKSKELVVSGAISGQGKQQDQRSRIVNYTPLSSSTNGNIVIESNSVSITDGAIIATETRHNQGGGNITITADNFELSGYNQEIADGDFARNGNLESSRRKASSKIQGQLNNISNTTSDQQLSGANITIDASNITIADYAQITTRYSGSSEYGGDITLNANDINLVGNSLLSTQQLVGYDTNQPTGNISVNAADNLTIVDSAIVTSVNSLTGSGGNIDINANNMLLKSATLDTSILVGIGDGGNITIESNRSIISADTIFNTSSKQSIDGTVEIHTTRLESDIIGTPSTNRNDSTLLNINACEKNTQLESSTLLVSNSNPHQYEIRNSNLLDFPIISMHANDHDYSKSSTLKPSKIVSINSIFCTKEVR